MLETDLIHSNGMLSGKVLLRACEEGLREEESRDPVDLWRAFFIPPRQEVDTIVAVHDPGRQWLQTEGKYQKKIFYKNIFSTHKF